jgi:hypothetical protein
MPILTEGQVRRAAQNAPGRSYKSVSKILQETRDSQATAFDVFLSHSKLDSELVLGVKAILEERGQTVYVDWLDDPELDRSQVTARTAERLRQRMRQCRSLIYVYSRHAVASRWMPWELGYFDAQNGNVAVLPVAKTDSEGVYRGEEFVGLYPYVDIGQATVWIHRTALDYAKITDWRVRGDKLRTAA